MDFSPILGIYFYHEAITKTEIIGLVLGVISITLIFWNN